MNTKNLLLLLVCFGISITLTSCKKSKQEIVEVQEKRVSGPLSDTDVEWSEADYK